MGQTDDGTAVGPPVDVVVIDDHPLFSRGLALLLPGLSGGRVRVVGTTDDASAAAALGSIGRTPEHAAELLELARAQTAHLASMLRTADATGGAVRRTGSRLLRDVVQAAAASSGLPRTQLAVELRGEVGDVPVADARVQRILTNLLENAHRHGGGAPVRFSASGRPRWVDLAVTQDGVPADRVVGHLGTTRPPMDLTGLGLWSVQRQTHELGGRLVWDDDGSSFTLTVQLPDR